MTDTRGPAPGKVPPHVKDRLDEKRRKAENRAVRGPAWLRPPALAAYGLVLLLIGVGIGTAVAGDPAQDAADAVAEEVLTLANEAEALFRTGLAGGISIAEAGQALETQNDTGPIEENLDAWVAEHQRILDGIEAVELDPLAQPVRDLFHAYVRAQLDTVVLFGAAAAHDGSARQELLRAAIRELGRSRALLSDARTALTALGGPTTPAVDEPAVPGLTRPGQPLPSPFVDPLDGEATEPAEDEASEPAGDEASEDASSADDTSS